jgi:hypothetical protein
MGSAGAAGGSHHAESAAPSAASTAAFVGPFAVWTMQRCAAPCPPPSGSQLT